MFGKPADNRTEKEKFLDEFEETVNDRLNRLQLTELRASRETLKQLNLSPQNGQTNIWGLIVTGEKAVYFYQAPQDSYLAKFMEKRDPSYTSEEKVINLSDFNIKYSLLPAKKTDFLFPERKRTINAVFTGKDSQEYEFVFVLNCKASEFINELQ